MSLSRFIPRAAALSRVTVARSSQNIHRRWVPRAMYSADAGLSRDVITSRILETLKGYEKIDPAKVCWGSGYSTLQPLLNLQPHFTFFCAS